MKGLLLNPQKPIQALAQQFSQMGVKLYLVGGYVRNALLSLYAADLDVASSATSQQVMAFFKHMAGYKVIPKAVDYGTVQVDVLADGKKTSFEHTTFRQDFYHDGGGHRPSSVVFTTDMREDALRRDFTINAIYYDIMAEKVEDPLGGRVDLAACVIKAAKPDARETLSDDGLRLMRLARFAAELNFKIDPKLFKTAKQYAHYLADISPERKQQEMKKVLLADTKYADLHGVFNARKHKRGVVILKEMGALKYLFMPLTKGQGFAQHAKYHAYDVLMHGINTMAETPPDYALRLAGLLHDVAKPIVATNTGKMIGHDLVGADMARQMLNEIKTPKAITRQTTALIKHHMFDLNGAAKTNTVKKKAGMLGYMQFTKLIALRRADFNGSGKPHQDQSADHWQQVLDNMKKTKTPETIADLALDGKTLMDVLGIESGQLVGWVLGRLHALALLNPKQNTKTHLLNHARRLLKERQDTHD